MTAIRNANVVFTRSTAAGSFLAYTVPAGFVFLMKSIVWQNWGATGSAYVSIAKAGTPVFDRVSYWTSDANIQWHEWSGWVPLNEGMELHPTVPDANMDIMIGGALLPFAPGL